MTTDIATLGIRVDSSQAATAAKNLDRMSGYSDAGFSTEVFSTGWVDYWADAYPWGTRPWGAYGLTSPKLSPEEAAGYAAIWWKVLGSTAILRYLQIELDDEDNDDGYWELPRVVAAPAWRLKRNPDIGFETGWKTTARKRRGRKGTVFTRSGAFYRYVNAALSYLEEDDAFAGAFDAGRRAGIDQECVWVLDPNATKHALRQTVYGQLIEPPGVRWMTPTLLATALKFEELV